MTDEEKAVFAILNGNSPIELVELKTQSELSNKKWDKAIKGLPKNKLGKVENSEESLLIHLS